MAQNKKPNSLIVVLLVICVILLVLISFIGGMMFSSFRSGSIGFMSGMMSGSGMMGSSAGVNSSSMMAKMDQMMGNEMTVGAKSISKAQLDQLALASKRGAAVDKKSNTVIYGSGQSNIVALASPSGKPDMTFEIDGLVNPTVIVPRNSNVQITVVNTDPDELHGLEVTPTSPPYSAMPMMSVNNDFLLMPIPHPLTKSAENTQFYSRSGQFNLRPGTYYYLCPVPGHAQKGMYGVLRVK